MPSKGDQSRGRLFSRRWVLRNGAYGAAALASLSLLSCSSGDDDSGGPTSSGSTPSTGSGDSGSSSQPKSGGELRVGLGSELSSLEPHLIANAQVDVLWPVFDTLTKYDRDLKPQPQLVAEWEQSDGGAKYVLHFRKDVKWHSGKEFTAQDVKWNFERVKDPELAFGQYRTMSTWFPTIDMPDPYTLILTSDKPRPGTFDFFEMFRIADPDTMEGPDAATKAIGTGAWKFVEWKQGVDFKLEKNPEYWNAGLPYLDGVTWSVALDAQTMQAQLESGALDAARDPLVTGFASLRDNPDFQAIVHPSPGAYYLQGINTTIEPFTDKRVRQAFNWAADRQRFSEVNVHGITGPSCIPWPEVSLAYNEDQANHYTFDLQKAKDLLSAANATSIKTTITGYPPRPEAVEFLPIWQADLKEIGVDASVQILETPAFINSVNSLKYDALYGAAGANFAGLGSPASLFSTTPQLFSGDGNNNTGYTNDQWVDLQLRAAVEIDPDKARAIYQEWNDLFLDSGHLPIMGPWAPRIAASKKVQGIQPHMHDGFEFLTASFA